jgi:hypothetical protein
MTEQRRRTRWPKAKVKALAWATAAATFVTGVSAIVAAPKAAVATSGRERTGNRAQVQRVIVRKVIRRVVIVDPATPSSTGAAPVQVVSSNPVTSAPQPAPAPAPPATTTGGS